jgi:hypothetical protein
MKMLRRGAAVGSRRRWRQQRVGRAHRRPCRPPCEASATGAHAVAAAAAARPVQCAGCCDVGLHVVLLELHHHDAQALLARTIQPFLTQHLVQTPLDAGIAVGGGV